MRITLRLEDHLLAEVKKMAAETGTTTTAIIEDALPEKLARRATPQSRLTVKFTIFRGKGLRPGVDLDSSAGLLDLMESEQ